MRSDLCLPSCRRTDAPRLPSQQRSRHSKQPGKCVSACLLLRTGELTL